MVDIVFLYCDLSSMIPQILSLDRVCDSDPQSAWSMGPSCGTFHLAAELDNHGLYTMIIIGLEGKSSLETMVQKTIKIMGGVLPNFLPKTS